MKVIIAEAGTDPTKFASTGKGSSGISAWLSENKILVLAVAIFLIVTVVKTASDKKPQPSTATSTATQAVISTPAVTATTVTDGCIGGPPGEWEGFHADGIYENGVIFVLQIEPKFTARCERGTWQFNFESK